MKSQKLCGIDDIYEDIVTNNHANIHPNHVSQSHTMIINNYYLSFGSPSHLGSTSAPTSPREGYTIRAPSSPPANVKGKRMMKDHPPYQIIYKKFNKRLTMRQHQ